MDDQNSRVEAVQSCYTLYTSVLAHWAVNGRWWQLRPPKGARILRNAISYLVDSLEAEYYGEL